MKTHDTDAALRAWATAVQKIARGNLAQLTTTEREAVTRYGGASLLRPRATPLQRKVMTNLQHTPPIKIRVKP